MKYLLKQDNTHLKVECEILPSGQGVCAAEPWKVRYKKGCHGASLLLIPTFASV